ncbi:MAG TPA: hypothetical protein VNV35_00550 [Puia sp.]|nr:hypothetical protein [Puia sp.]
MPKYLFLIFFSFFNALAFGQNKEPVSIDISADTLKGKNFAVYNICISNFGDSIVCILRSPTIVLGVGFPPQDLAVRVKDSVKELYELEYSARDTNYNYEGPIYHGVIILPRQALYFKIRIPFSTKDQLLSVEYTKVYDLCYRDFVSGMIGAPWLKKYHVNSKMIAIPSKGK